MKLLEILRDYEENFCNKMCCIETSYKEMNFIHVYFSKTDLHHLLGLHKVISGSATNSIKSIESGYLTLNHIRKHKNFGIIRPRINSYPFIHEIFLKKDVELCIVEKDIDPNTMYLNLIIYKNKGHEVIVLGLKKNNKNSIYYLATLHKTYENKYQNARKTKIRNIIWLD